MTGAKVACLGKSGTTSATGTAKLHFNKGAPVGKHGCKVSKSGYAAGQAKLKVT